MGATPTAGEEIEAHNGRFGPYLKKGTDTRSLQSEEQLLTVTLDEALALFAQPKTRGSQAKAATREMGADPDTGLPMVVKDGPLRSLRHRRHHQRVVAQGRRGRGPSPPERAVRAPGRPAGAGPSTRAKKAPAKKAAKKAAKEGHGQEDRRPRRRRPKRHRPRRRQPEAGPAPKLTGTDSAG